MKEYIDYNEYNDNELIYLYRECNNEHALNLLFEKYQNFIYRMVINSGIDSFNLEDCQEECMISMYEAIMSYDMNNSLGKTFLRYLELIVQRKISRFKDKIRKYKNIQKKYQETCEVSNNVNYLDELINTEILNKYCNILTDNLDEKELRFFYDAFVLELSTEELAKKYHVKKSNIYIKRQKLRYLLRKNKK